MNIGVHEFGHYAAAKQYGLDPKMHFEVKPVESGVLKNVMYTTSFYTEYNAPAINPVKEDAVIAFSGPLVNIIVSLLLTLAYFLVPKNTPRKRLISVVIILFLIPSVLSVILNLIPLSGTDGSVMMQVLA